VDLVNRFAKFAQAARKAGWPLRFVATGDLSGWPVQITPEVELAGYVDDLPAFYRNVDAVAVLSPIGYGFKTTIADAVFNGAKVLVHPSIGSVLPDELKPYCAMVDVPTPEELRRARSLLHEQCEVQPAVDALTRRFNEEMTFFLERGARAEPYRSPRAL
jgi:hypothetical protein